MTRAILRNVYYLPKVSNQVTYFFAHLFQLLLGDQTEYSMKRPSRIKVNIFYTISNSNLFNLNKNYLRHFLFTNYYNLQTDKTVVLLFLYSILVDHKGEYFDTFPGWSTTRESIDFRCII